MNIKLEKVQWILIAYLGSLFLLGITLSGQTDTMSTSVTDYLMIKFGIISQIDVDLHKNNYSVYSNIFREVGHFVMYAIGAWPIFMLVYSFTKKIVSAVPISSIIVIVYVFMDETHQSYVKGRTFERFDFIMDIGGASFSIALACMTIIVLRHLSKVDF